MVFTDRWHTLRKACQLRAEIAALEQRIDDLTEISPGSEFASRS